MIRFLLLAGFALAAAAAHGEAMPPAQIRQILELTKENWISFRDYDGRQLIYFTHLESWKCGIREVRYGINGDQLDHRWDLQACDPDNPNAVTKDEIYLSFPLETVITITIQLTYADGTVSEPTRFASGVAAPVPVGPQRAQ